MYWTVMSLEVINYFIQMLQADRLAKEAARSENMQYVLDRIPKSTLHHKAEVEAKQEWQTEWSTTHKAAATRHYFPTVRDRLRLKLKLIPKGWRPMAQVIFGDVL